MNQDVQLKLQAHLDGELSESETREVNALLARDPEARALLEELKNTNRALAVFESELKLPESREFFWSKIEREIKRQEQPATAAPRRSIFAVLQRMLLPTGAVAGLLLAALFVSQQLGPGETRAVTESEMAFDDPEGFTYRDYASGTTLVWLSYPAENDFAE